MTVEIQPLNQALKDCPGGADLAGRLGEFAGQLAAQAGANLVSLVVFGGVARGRYVPGRSDVNVVIVLERADEPALSAIAPALRAAWRSAAVEPMILTRDQLPAAARSFPTKFLDIQAFHIRLAGTDVFAGLDAPAQRVRWRVEQELQNLAIRLRRRAVASSGDDASLARELAGIARPLAIELGWLLRVSGKTVPEEDRTAAIFDLAATSFGLDRGALAELAAIRQEPGAKAGLMGLTARVTDSMLIAAGVAARSEGQAGPTAPSASNT